MNPMTLQSNLYARRLRRKAKPTSILEKLEDLRKRGLIDDHDKIRIAPIDTAGRTPEQRRRMHEKRSLQAAKKRRFNRYF